MNYNLSLLENTFSIIAQLLMFVSAITFIIGWLPLIVLLFRYSNQNRLTASLRSHQKLPKTLFILSFSPLILFLIFSIAFIINSAINGINQGIDSSFIVYGSAAAGIATVYIFILLLISFTYIPLNIITSIAIIKYQSQYLNLKKGIKKTKKITKALYVLPFLPLIILLITSFIWFYHP